MIENVKNVAGGLNQVAQNLKKMYVSFAEGKENMEAVELTKYDNRVINARELNKYYLAGGYSRYAIIKMSIIIITVAIDIFLILTSLRLNASTMIIIFLMTCFVFMNGKFIYINRNIFYRLRYRLMKLPVSKEFMFKATCYFQSCKYNDDGTYQLIVSSNEEVVEFNTNREIHQRCRNLSVGESIELFFYKLNLEDEDFVFNEVCYPCEVLKLKEYAKKYIKVSKRNPFTNEKIKKTRKI